MISCREHAYIETDTVTGFIKPYKDDLFSFMALLSKDNDIPIGKILEKISFTKLLRTASYENVAVSLPESIISFSKPQIIKEQLAA